MNDELENLKLRMAERNVEWLAEDGGFAYPSTIGRLTSFGLRKRELFAAMAMQGLLAATDNEYPPTKALAKKCTQYADALMEALNEEPPNA